MPLALEVLQEFVGADTPLRYFCQDESRWGLLTLSGRVITLRGVKPEGRYQWGRSTFWLYGLVEPLTGDSYFEQFDHLNREHFEQFIHQFAARYAEEVVVIQIDQAIAHRAQEIDWPENIIPLFQPAYPPEVNPIERFWKHLKTPAVGTLQESEGTASTCPRGLGRNDQRCGSLSDGMGLHYQCCIKCILKLNWYKCYESAIYSTLGMLSKLKGYFIQEEVAYS